MRFVIVTALALALGLGVWLLIGLRPDRDGGTIVAEEPGTKSPEFRPVDSAKLAQPGRRSAGAPDAFERNEARAILAEIESELNGELELEHWDDDGVTEEEPFDEHFDSATMYFPVAVDGPLTQAHYPDGSIHFRAEQKRSRNGWHRDGSWLVWHKNGQAHEDGTFKEGLEHGNWRWWYPNGNSMAEGEFVDGDRVGPWSFYHQNGRLAMEGQYVAGSGDGHWIHFDENGTKRAEGDFVDGQPGGNWVSYDENGQLVPELSGDYLNGSRRD